LILLDTNIVSAVMTPEPPPPVIAWLNGQPTDTLYLPTVAIAEIAYGLQALPEGRRRRDLRERFERFVARGFDQRILAFDEPAAHRYGEIMARRRAAGRSMSVLDGQIAAIAWAHGAIVATRNVRDFEECGLVILDPFEGPA
jgi:toxin FitB